jgi:NAD(P)-dependent dehydrogenase (short-subunit alcohol dehydrogenase family)
VALVTGAGRGIGRATAALLAREGARVWVADIDCDLAAQSAASIGCGAVARAIDVADECAVAALMEEIGAREGRLDVLVSNAGRPYSLTSLEAGAEDWRECLDVNLKSVWLCARAAHPLLRKSERAAIVTVASAQGQRGGRSTFPYSAAKGGLLALTRSLAVEYAPEIRVNAVVPGQVESVRTESFFRSFRDPEEAQRRVLATFPLRRLGKPEDIARAIAFLASEDAAWITGVFLHVDGGRDAAMLDLSDLK